MGIESKRWNLKTSHCHMGEPLFFPFPTITWGRTHIKARSSWKDSVRLLVRLAVRHKQTIYQDGGRMLPTADPNETLLGWFISRWWTPDSHAGKCQKKEKVSFFLSITVWLIWPHWNPTTSLFWNRNTWNFWTNIWIWGTCQQAASGQRLRMEPPGGLIHL